MQIKNPLNKIVKFYSILFFKISNKNTNDYTNWKEWIETKLSISNYFVKKKY